MPRGGPLFCSRADARKRNSSIQRYQKLAKVSLKVARELGLEGTLLDLRHLAAQLAEDNDASLTAIQQQLGQATTLR